jgi:hypothetical protein
MRKGGEEEGADIEEVEKSTWEGKPLKQAWRKGERWLIRCGKRGAGKKPIIREKAVWYLVREREPEKKRNKWFREGLKKSRNLNIEVKAVGTKSKRKINVANLYMRTRIGVVLRGWESPTWENNIGTEILSKQHKNS